MERTAYSSVKTFMVFTFVLLGIAGCGIYGTFDAKEYRIPENACGTGISGDTLSAGSVRWEDFFTDRYLCALIDTALKNNADLQTAMLYIEEAQAALQSSKLAFLPSFYVSPQASYNGSWSVQLPVNASWEIDLFGSLRNAKRAKQAALLRQEAYSRAVRSQLVATVATTYYSLLALDAQLEIYERTERTWKDNVEATRALVNAGRYNSASLSQTEAGYYEVCNSLLDIRQQISQMENRMCSLLGWVPGKIERGRIEDWVMPETISVGIPAKTLANRPDVKEAEHALEEAFYNTGQAKSEFYPSITISGSYDFSRMIADAIGSLVQPIFMRGTLKANLKIAVAQQQEAEIAFRQCVIDAGMEVNDALISISTARAKQENCSRQVSHLEDAVKSTRLLMVNSSATYLEVLAAQQTLLEAQIGEVVNTLSGISGVITLYHALGGGSTEP